jgi:hypothetical protein
MMAMQMYQHNRNCVRQTGINRVADNPENHELCDPKAGRLHHIGQTDAQQTADDVPVRNEAVKVEPQPVVTAQ